MTAAQPRTTDRAGLIVLCASLVAAIIVGFVALRHQTAQQTHELSDTGTRLVKALSAIPLDGLVPSPGRPSPLAGVLRAHGSADLAYGLVTDLNGRTLAEVTAPGLTPAPLPISPDKPAEWFGQGQVEGGVAGLMLTEFHAPLLRDGHLEGFVRVAFRQPGIGLDARQLPFLAGLALPVLLLAPIFFAMLRHQLRPFQALGQRIEGLAARNDGEVSAGDVVSRFARFLDAAEQRIRELEERRSDSETAVKLLGYKKEKVESALETLPEGVLVLDESGEAVFANAKVGPLIGIDPAGLLHKGPAQWPIAPEILDILSPLILGISPANHDNDFAPAGDTNRRVSVWALPLFAPRDNTRRLGTLLVLRETTDQLLAARARDEFIAHVAHELKTPLANISLYGNLLRDEPDLPAETRIEAINTVCDEVERSSSLISNLLSISRIEAGSIVIERKRVRLADLLSDCMDYLSHNGHTHGLTLKVDVPPELPPIELDKDLLRIALNNLLNNAVKYNRPGGEVTLSAEETDDRVVIVVQDTGIGIPPADLPRIFDKFYRSAERDAVSRGGHGLGLYLARQIVEIHQGQIGVVSQPGQGTRITLSFRKPHVLLRAA